jgi:hypothetical protein
LYACVFVAPTKVPKLTVAEFGLFGLLEPQPDSIVGAPAASALARRKERREIPAAGFGMSHLVRRIACVGTAGWVAIHAASGDAWLSSTRVAYGVNAYCMVVLPLHR